MSVIWLQLYRLDLLPVSLSGKLYFFSICNISLIKMYKPDDLLVAKKLFNAVFIYRKRALFKWKNLIPYMCNIFGVKNKTTLFSHQSLLQPFFGMPCNVPHKVSLRGALHDISKNGCEGDYLVIGCHLTVVSGFSHFFYFHLYAGVHLPWRVQTVKLMKMLQNQSRIFMLPRNLLGENTSEIHVP